MSERTSLRLLAGALAPLTVSELADVLGWGPHTDRTAAGQLFLGFLKKTIDGVGGGAYIHITNGGADAARTEEPTMTYAIDLDALTVTILDGIPCVSDPEGGIWLPSDEAIEEIEASADPESTALRICRERPMRGTWRC